MGTDDLFHKRRQQREKSPKRAAAKQKRSPKILVVTEGSKTEPNYFEGLRRHYRVPSLFIDGSGGSSPASLVEHGLELYQQASKVPYNRVYFVFDKDTHHSYDQALHRIAALEPKGTFFPIPSVPCFEYWLLLHFEYTTRPYMPVGKNSAAAILVKDLQRHISGYSKPMQGLFAQLLGRLETAKKHAARALRESEANNTDLPSTRVHQLVGYLQNPK